MKKYIVLAGLLTTTLMWWFLAAGRHHNLISEPESTKGFNESTVPNPHVFLVIFQPSATRHQKEQAFALLGMEIPKNLDEDHYQFRGFYRDYESTSSIRSLPYVKFIGNVPEARGD